jgi:putative redox protein
MTIKEVVVRNEGGMHLVASTGSGFQIEFDSGRERIAAGPTEGVLAALASCSAMDVISIMAKKRQSFDRYEIRVRGDQRSEYPQVFSRIDVVHELEGPNLEVSAVRRSIELSATKYCPVIAMIGAGATEVHSAYRVIRTGSLPLDESGEVCVIGPYRRPEIVRRG